MQVRALAQLQRRFNEALYGIWWNSIYDSQQQKCKSQQLNKKRYKIEEVTTSAEKCSSQLAQRLDTLSTVSVETASMSASNRNLSHENEIKKNAFKSKKMQSLPTSSRSTLTHSSLYYNNEMKCCQRNSRRQLRKTNAKSQQRIKTPWNRKSHKLSKPAADQCYRLHYRAIAWLRKRFK